MNEIISPFNFVDMQRYSFPTPPSTNEDSPVSLQMVPSPSNISENSSSPVHFSKQLLIVPNYGIIPQYQNINNEKEIQPCLKVIEQPVDKFRFRYKSEMTGTHGSLNGVNSDRTRKLTYPTVELLNYEGIAMIRCSIWQVNHHGKILPHAHRLVKKKHGKEEVDDPHDILVNKDSNYQATFHSMGIIHTAKKNIVTELIKKKTRLKRESIFVFENRKDLTKKEELEIKGLAEAESKSINLNVVCLRFDAYFVGENNAYLPLCEPVYSHSINNLKSALTGELKIVRMDHCTSPANGGREIFLLVERVTKKNIKVRFYELDDEDNVSWEAYGQFTDLDVHHQFAIVLRTPAYKRTDITSQVQVCMELVRPSDNARSEPKFFTYIPKTNAGLPNGKRQRTNNFDSMDYDTPSAGCEVLPTVLQEMNASTINLSGEISSVGELPDMNSDEFRKLFDTFLPEYLDASAEENLTMDIGRSYIYCNMPRSVPITSRDLRPRLQNREYEGHIEKVYNELKGLLRTKPPLEEVKEKLRHYLMDNCEDLNAFHMAVLINASKYIQFFVKMIFTTGEFDLVNLQTHQRGTVLHLATICENVDLIMSLISMCNADISKCDVGLNTPLHVAAKSNISEYVLSALLKAKNVSTHIDDKNEHGDTPLVMAVKANNIRAVQLLCDKGADVDYRHNSNGFTPLRFAVEYDNLPLVEYFLSETKADPRIRDFKEVDPLQVALCNRKSLEIGEFIRTYMLKNDMPFDEINIKEEPEDCYSEDEMVICQEEKIKAEPLPAINDGGDLAILYENVSNFTAECLAEICTLLDSSGKWQDLASLLDLEHLLGNKILEESKSPSKYLLNYVVEVDGGSIKEIRDFLENLDEVKAANAIDEMVKKIHNSGL